MTVKFCVLGEPMVKKRPRASMRAGHAVVYTPKDTVNYENLVRYAYQEQVGTKLNGAIEALIRAYFPIPKSISKKKHEMYASENYPCMCSKDADNVGKICMDAINKVAYDDDRQIYRLTVEKWYSDKPRVEIELSEYEE